MSLELFETQSPLKLLARFAWPSIVSLVANALYNVVDRAFVGHLVGTPALTAVSVVFPLSIAVFAVALGLGSGVASRVSLKLGAQERGAAEVALGQGLGLSLVASIVLALVLVPLTEPLLVALATPSEVVGPAREYFLITLLGMPFLTLSLGVGSAIRSQGRAKTALVTGLVGIVLNVVFCVLFVGCWGWGLDGSAWATALAQGLGALVTVGFYFTPWSSLRFRRANLRLRASEVGPIVELGFPTFVGQIIGMVLMVILNVRVQAYGGATALAVVGIFTTLSSLLYMPAFGLVQGAVPLFGYYQGAGRVAANRKLFRWVLAGLTAYFVVLTVGIELWPEALLGIFSQDPALVQFGVVPLRVFLALTFLAGFQTLPQAYFQAVGKPKPSVVLSLGRPVALGLLVVVLPLFWGFDGFLASGPLSDGVGLVMALGYLVADKGRPGTSVDSRPEIRP